VHKPLEFGNDWNNSVEVSRIKYNGQKFWMFHQGNNQISVTRDFETSFTFSLNEGIDSISIDDQEMLFSQASRDNLEWTTKYFKFSSEYTSRVFTALLDHV